MPKLHLIKDILDQRAITMKAFSAEIGMSESGLKRIIKQNSTRIQTVELIAEALHIPVGYLFGDDAINERQQSASRRQRDKLPHIPVHAQAGSLAGFSNGVTDEECDLLEVIPALGSYDYTIDVRGDSMLPEYHSGDVVACRLVRDLTELKSGKIYVLDT
ncbi:MAG: XRE family transcriptional regulator, partial [Bacteroidales bacterium]